MKSLFVFADFDWLPSVELIGQLSFDSVRGSETYGFSFHKDWLINHGDIFLSDDLHNFPGIQYTRPEKDIFSCFSDALPDRWGRKLLLRREQIDALDQNRAVRRLSSFDLLTGIDDYSRMGGFRFANTLDGNFINSHSSLKVPPLASVKELMRAAINIETSEENHILPSKKWINQLIHPGSSLGGARPKASVVDENGCLLIAKFPSAKDTYDVAKWEHLAHVMGKKAGIEVAHTRVSPGAEYNILLSKRFDRNQEGRRIHFASALTLLGLNDGDNADCGVGYPDIVDFILQRGSHVEDDLQELYRRVAYYIMIGNSDDHLRNHGFLLTKKGWKLSPAYDINPTLSDYQSLLISRNTNQSDLNILLESAEDYMLPFEKAHKIIEEVKSAMKSWEYEAKRLGISQRDIDMFAPRISKWLV